MQFLIQKILITESFVLAGAPKKIKCIKASLTALEGQAILTNPFSERLFREFTSDLYEWGILHIMKSHLVINIHHKLHTDFLVQPDKHAAGCTVTLVSSRAVAVCEFVLNCSMHYFQHCMTLYQIIWCRILFSFCFILIQFLQAKLLKISSSYQMEIIEFRTVNLHLHFALFCSMLLLYSSTSL